MKASRLLGVLLAWLLAAGGLNAAERPAIIGALSIDPPVVTLQGRAPIGRCWCKGSGQTAAWST